MLKALNLRTMPLLLLLVLSVPTEAQAISPTVSEDEKLLYVGMTLAQLFERFGSPQTVAVARGAETWQDDVVFSYTEGDFYIHKDRVWQIRLLSACGVNTRDRKAAVMLILGNTAQDNGDHVLLSIPEKNWPLSLRVNFNNSGQVTAIFIYRPDY